MVYLELFSKTQVCNKLSLSSVLSFMPYKILVVLMGAGSTSHELRNKIPLEV